MRARHGVLVLVALSLAGPAAAQVGARRVQPTAFPLAVTPSFALGFGAVRATEQDQVQHRISSGPALGVDLQAPLGRTLGVGLAGSVSRPVRKICVLGQCESGQRVTAVHGALLLLWRFKPRAPIFFGIGPAVTFFTPGPVLGQADAVLEPGGVVVVAYDAQLGAHVGVRVAWWNYLTKPSDKSLTTNYTMSGLAYDKAVAFGVRYQP